MREQAKENFEIFKFHFEAVKDSNNKMPQEDEEKLLKNIINAEAILETKIFGPICHKVYHILTSNVVYEKIFDYDFERSHHSVFNFNYKDVFDHAEQEADASIIQNVYEKILNPTKSELADVYDELRSDDSDADDNIYERQAKKLQKKAMANLKATPEYEENFRSSIHFTFENTLFSAMNSSYKNIFDSMFNTELQNVLNSVKESL